MSEPSASTTVIRQLALAADKPVRRRANPRSFGAGIVAEPPLDLHIQGAPRIQTADTIFPPTQPPPIGVSNGGGAIGTGLPVQLIFWGGAWNQPATNPSVATIVAAARSILGGPYMAGLRQYGIRRCGFGGSSVVTSPGPPATYQDDDIRDLVWRLIDSGQFPEPDDSGGRIIYMVFMPPGTTYGPGGIRGKHLVASDFDFPADIDHAWAGFVLFNGLTTILSTFTHELVEMCTDPESDAWHVTGNQEIGDVCNAVDGPLNGVNVQSYWSAEDNACLIPTAYSVRRALKWSGHVLGGKGLTSIQKPIPSLNKLIVNL
ncbi:MAG TPA: hypothetical protein VKQ27_15190 [Acetobacteraceae bacterium]|nr:hypothetical protein [Acetobacteraceae bacterium]